MCTLQRGAFTTVTGVLDGETVQLDDGTTLRLAGIVAPRSRDAHAAAGSWAPERDAIAALSRHVLGKRVELAYTTTARDRYGRRIAHAFTSNGGQRLWIQGELVASGHARASAMPGDTACVSELLAHERLARTGRLGLWRVGTYRVRAAHRTFELMRARSTFQIVAGTVDAVSRTRSGTYVNFGSDWRTDFTVRVPASVIAAHGAWAAGLDGLKGRRVEVRGWIDRRNGPLIEIATPGQITAADDAPIATARTPSRAVEDAAGSAPGDDSAAQSDAPGEGATAPDSDKKNRPERAAPGDFDL